MAISTIGVFLMHKPEGKSDYEKLVDIKTHPAMGGAPEQLETTTMSNFMRTYIPGLEANDAKEYTCNYTKVDYQKLKALEGQELDLALYFGGTKENGAITPTGADGKFSYKGYINVYISEGDINAVENMTVTTTASSEITFS